jgi:HK97 gp10 family phage protein
MEARVVRKKKAEWHKKFRQAQVRFLVSAGITVEGAAKELSPVDQGNLRGSITYDVQHEQTVVGTNADYAPHVEYGTRPHFPPVSAIREWSGRVLGDKSAAWPIAKKIARRGTPAQPFLRPALDKNRKKLVRLFGKILRDVVRGR